MNSHGHNASANDTSPRRSKKLSLQKKLDARKARKYLQTDKDNSINDETLISKETLSDGSDDVLLFPEMGGSDD